MASGLLSKAGTFLTGLSDENDASVQAGVEYADANDMATGDTAADAVRHMTMSALATREYPNAGGTLMQLYESMGSGDRRAQRMDEYNNAMGAAKFLELPEEYRQSMSDEEVAAYMTEIVDEEYQYRLKNDGKPSGKGPKFYEKPLATKGAFNEGGAVTSAGRKVYKDENGENYSEKTETIQIEAGWINAPTVTAEGDIIPRDKLEDMYNAIGPVDPLTGRKLQVFESVEEAVDSAEKTSEGYGKELDGYNEGGLMAEEQTDGEMPITGHDPVSGNPIPPGSTAENVRDDIPAMLSEGEFVLPADVVKWHGLKHIMEMRDEAKCGLMGMEGIGQIKNVEEELGESEEMEHEHEEAEATAPKEEAPDTMDENGNGEYPTELGQMSNVEYGDEHLLVLMAADGGFVDTASGLMAGLIDGKSSEESSTDTSTPKQRLVRRMVRDPETGKMIVVFVDINTGKQITRGAVQAGLDAGTMETIDQSPEQQFAEIQKGAGQEQSTSEEVVEEAGSVTAPFRSGGDGGSGMPDSQSEPMDRTLANNYGFVDPTKRAVALGVAGAIPIPGSRVLGAWGINANNTDAVNAARADLGLDPVDTSLGVNLDAATGMVADDYNIGPFAADVTMNDQYGRRLSDIPDADLGFKDSIKSSKAARFMSGVNPTDKSAWESRDVTIPGYLRENGPRKGEWIDEMTFKTSTLPYKTSSTLTPSEIAEKRAAGLNFQDGRWGYSTAAEEIGRGTLSEMSDDKFGSDIGLSTADNYGLSIATDRGRQEAIGIASQDAELFDDNDDGKLDVEERRNMQEFYNETGGSGGSNGLGYSSDYGSSSEAAAVASDGFGSDAHFDAIDQQFNDLPSSSGSSGSSGGSSGNSVSTGGGGTTRASGADWSSSNNSADSSSMYSNKGGLMYRPKKKYATIKK